MIGPLFAAALAAHPMPDPRLTPGAMAPNVTRSQVCSSGYAAAARKRLTTTTKDRVWAAYGVPRADRPEYRLDHFYPIETGGCAWCAENLWPEPVADSKEKDRLEGRLHADLCAGRIRLEQVPELVRKGWWSP